MTTPSRGPAPAPQEKNLPLYAQKMLADYRRAIEDWEAYAVAARAETRPDETDTIVGIYTNHPLGLPHGETVRFRLTNQDIRREAYIDVRMVSDGFDRGWLFISGGDQIEVRPQSGNAVRVRQVPYDNR